MVTDDDHVARHQTVRFVDHPFADMRGRVFERGHARPSLAELDPQMKVAHVLAGEHEVVREMSSDCHRTIERVRRDVRVIDGKRKRDAHVSR
jgi:hypothetical protein